MAKVYIFGAGVTKAIYHSSLLNDDLLPAIVKLPSTSKLAITPKKMSMRTRAGRIKRLIADFYGGQRDDTLLFVQAANRLEWGHLPEAKSLIERPEMHPDDTRNLRQILDAASNQHPKVEQMIENARVIRAQRIVAALDPLPRLEDVLNLIEFEIREKRSLGPYWTPEVLHQLREDMAVAIAKVISNNLDPKVQPSIERYLLQQFITSLADDDYVVSLNYDVVIDDLIADHLGTANYEIEPRYRIEGQNGNTTPYETRVRPRLLKLHGSLNWLYCSNCEEIDVAAYHHETLAEHLKNPASSLATCSYCRSPYEPILITPTHLKEYDNPLVNQLWRKAEREIAKADEIIFVGFSMPDADVILRSMFTRALFRNRLGRVHRHTKTPYTITLVDYVVPNNATSQQAAAQTRERYLRLLGQIDDYISGGFAEYLERFRSIYNHA